MRKQNLLSLRNYILIFKRNAMRVNELIKDENFQIVIVDDTVEYLKFLSDILTNEGYLVRPFNSGELALRSIKENRPSLVLLDFVMPVMDGYEVCRALKADENTRDIPVIFISGSGDKELMLTGFQVGGVDFINKPFRKEEVLARVKTHISLYHFQLDLKAKNEMLQDEIIKRKQAELAIEKRMTAITQPVGKSMAVDFGDLFNIAELQKLQDQFASAFGVASIITQPDGKPITSPSNFSRLCQNIIRCTEKGLLNCMYSDSVIGRNNPEGPVVQTCLSGGLWDAGASISVGGKHVANWLVGQVRSEVQQEGKMTEYAREIGADEADFMQAFGEITSMSREQFQKISEVLFTMAGQLSTMAYQNMQQNRFINERKEAEAALVASEARFRTTLYSIGDGVITTDSDGKVSMMNPVAEQLTGWLQADAAGKILEEVFPIINEETREQVEIPVRKVLREGVIVGLANHTLLIAKDGTERPIADSGAPIRNKNGEIVGVVLVFRDQTEERRAEKVLIETKKRFRLLYENAPLSYQSLDPQARLIDVNPVWLRTMGYSGKDEVIGHHFGEFMTAESAELIKNRFSDFVAAGEIHNYEFDMVRKDGTIITVSYEGKIGYDELGHFKQTHCIFTDITEQRKAELALKESEEKFRNIVESSPIGKYFYHLEEDGNLIFMGSNPSADKIIGVDHQTLIGKTIQEAFPNLAQTQVPEIYAQIARGEIGTQFFEIEYFENQINGFFQVTVFRIGNNSIAVDFMDISDRKKTEIALRQNEEKFRSLFENAAIGISITSMDGTMQINPVLHEMLGYSESEFRNKKWQEITHPDDIQKSLDFINALVEGKAERLHFEKRYLHKSGNTIWTDVSATLNRDLNNNPLYFITSINDVTKRKEAEESLRRNERKFRALIENSSDAISLVDSNGIEFYHSSSCQHILGYSDVERKGRSMMELIHPDDRESMINMFTDILKNPGILTLLPTRVKHSNGSWIWIEGVANNLLTDSDIQAIVINFRDVTERKQFELKLQRSEQELKRAQQITHIGSWYLNLADNDVYWSEELYKMYGLDPNLPVPPFTEHMKLFTPESWELLSTSLANTAETGIPYELELKTVREDGSNGWMWARGETVKDSTGKTVGLWGAAQDISARKQAEQALFESEEMMRNSQSVAHSCSYSTNLNENELGASPWICSPEFYKIFGIDKTYPHTLEGWAGFIHPDYREEMVAYHEYVIKERLPFEHEYKIVRISDGVERWVYGTGKLEFDEKGNPVRMHGAIQDITERKQDLEAIQNERQLLRTLIDHLPDPIYVKDNEGRKLLANRADLENIGVLDESEVLGKSALEIFNTEIGYRDYEDDLIVIEKGEAVINREEIFVDKNGKKRWLLTTKVPILNKSGKPSGLVGIGRDITEQKKANETIQKLSKSIEQSPSTIVIADVLGNIEYVNPKFIEITGYTLEEVIGQNPRILQSGETPPEKYRELWNKITSGEVWRGEFLNRKKDGDLFWEWVTMTSIKDNHGEITNYIAIKEDISSRKQMEVDLIVAKEKAEENDRLKSAFLANMSHEIRTPLNSIIGFAELLSDPDFELDERYEFASLISASGNNLLAIITDIMDISKIEAGQVAVNRSVFNARKLVNDVHNEYRFRAHDKGIELRIASETPDEECPIYSDQIKTKQVLINFVGNALKFTENGFIEIGLKVRNESVEFFVRDTGLGISVAHREEIFERFRQVEDSSTRKYGGNGLGLAISKSLIEMMDGTIGMESEPGKGSTFYFTLPTSVLEV
ncbi:MAG: PAS domain S-box protein [Prolixibacteraceae bacterium]|nr:PAS domain S-box protein [Prolixibacteraceae bacterium]